MSEVKQYIHKDRIFQSSKLFTEVAVRRYDFPNNRTFDVNGVGVLNNFAKFAGKPLCRSIFFNKVAELRPAT